MHYNANTTHWGVPGHLRVDYRWSLANYRSHIYDYLNHEGFAVDTFFCTYSSPVEQELIHDFRPVKHQLVAKSADTNGSMPRRTGRNSLVSCGLNLAREHGAQRNFRYARVIMTRFDVIFREDFARSHFDWTRFNVVGRLEKDRFIDDNFYAFPGAFLDPFAKLMQKGLKKKAHSMEGDFRKFSKVNYIWETRGKKVADQRWFYIVRNHSNGSGCIVCH